MIPFTSSGLPEPAGPVDTPVSLMQSALDQPLSIPSTLFESAKEGATESFGLGTAIRDFTVPEGNPTPVSEALSIANGLLPSGQIYNVAKRLYQGSIGQDRTPMSEAEYKASPWFRDGVPWDSAMTADRAHALAVADDTKQVRAFYAQKRPITSFIGNVLGQALDPINYIPVGGELLAAKTGLGPVGRAMLGSSIDAAGNTAVASVATAPLRSPLGDDTSWESTVSNIAMAGLIGGAFGALHGVLAGRRASLPSEAEIADQIGTIGRIQESRVALNEAIDGIVNGRDVELSPNGLAAVDGAAAEMARVAELRATQPNIDFQNIGEVQRRIAEMDGGQRPQSLISFLASRGGLRDQGGELGAMELTGRFVPRYGRLVRQGGRTLDDARQIAAEAGFFPQYGSIDSAMQHSTVDDLLNAIREDQSGSPVYSIYDRERAGNIADKEAAQAAYDDAVRAVDEHAGDSALPGEIRTRAAELVYSTGAHPDDALERAIMEDYYANGAEGLPIVGKNGPIEVPGFDSPDHGGNAVERGPNGESGGRGEGRAQGDVASNGGASSSIGRQDRIAAANATPAPDPAAPEVKDATARIGTPEDIRALAEQHGVDEAGNYPEANEIAQIEKEGRLTAEDRAALSAADETFDRATAYGEALKSAATCII